MIRFTWLQFRMQAIVALAALFAFAVVLVLTGPHMASLYASAITGCHGGTPCDTAASHFLGRLADTSLYPIVYLLGIALILAAPAIIGIFWGAPLIARELEAGTYRLAWTQSITRTRWLVVKLALTGLAAMAVTEALSLMQAWWADPIGKADDLAASVPGLSHPFTGGRLSSWIFASHGITPLGYAAFGFALGTAAGALIRRTVPAMAVTLAIFAAAQVAMPLAVRPHLIPPDRTVVSGPSFFQAACDERRHTNRQHRPRPARSLDPLQRSHQRGGAACQHDSRPLPVGALGGKGRPPKCRGLHGQPGHPGGHHLPARQPLLALAVDRDRDLPRPRARPDRVLLLAARPPSNLTYPVVRADNRLPRLDSMLPRISGGHASRISCRITKNVLRQECATVVR